MPKAEWGVKHTCTSCAARFYDMLRNPITCPKCETEVNVTVIVKPKRVRPAASAAAAAKVAAREE